MNFVLSVQMLITVLGSIVLGWFLGLQQSASFATGSLAIGLSFSMMAIGYGLIFRKKMIALAVGIIVIKYAILGIIIFTLVKLAWFDPLWFALGVASLILSAIAYALKESTRENAADDVKENREGKTNGI
jgi:hypothetical protein